MKAWTHTVYCDEAIPAYGANYDIKAVQDEDGNWRCAERNLCGISYGQILTNVRIDYTRQEIEEW